MMMDVPAEPAEQRDWQALPAGVLQHIFYLASFWQRPGTCVAAPVCRSWRSAAAGCSRVRLLYHAGHKPADESFVTWLERNSGQLGALTLSSSDECAFLPSTSVLAALAEAAAAAQAAGRPLQLHTLRLLGGGVHTRVSLNTAGQLLAALPHLRCLQLGMDLPFGRSLGSADGRDAAVLEALAPLQRATHLEELYLDGPGYGILTIPLSTLLPPPLKRLSWGYEWEASQSLWHLNNLSYLHLSSCRHLSSSQLPPSLRQLQFVAICREAIMEVVEEQQEVVTAWGGMGLEQGEVQQLLERLPHVTAAAADSRHMCSPAAKAVFKQRSQLSALSLRGGGMFELYEGEHLQQMRAAVATAASMRGLRRLHLRWDPLPERLGLAALTQLTQLRLSVGWQGDIEQQQQRALVEEVGQLQGLQWLSVPGVLFQSEQAWLGGLQQLRVLAVTAKCTVHLITQGSSIPGRVPHSRVPHLLRPHARSVTSMHSWQCWALGWQCWVWINSIQGTSSSNNYAISSKAAAAAAAAAATAAAVGAGSV
jgi:hypothetical protein